MAYVCNDLQDFPHAAPQSVGELPFLVSVLATPVWPDVRDTVPTTALGSISNELASQFMKRKKAASDTVSNHLKDEN